MKKKMKTITLILTEKCNLNCVYCYENNKSQKKMSLETAYNIIDVEMTDHFDYDIIYIDLFGGEPFLEFDSIKRIMEYFNEKYNYKNVHFVTSTNATLVHDDIQEWIKNNYQNITVGLSLDGDKYSQDINRSDSFDKIDLNFFKKYYGNDPVKMTISPYTIEYLSDNVIFLHNKGFRVNCNLAMGQSWEDNKYIHILERELSKLIDYYLAHPEIEPCSMLNNEIKHLGYDNCNDVTVKWCGTGTDMHTYDVDGNKYPCQYFTPNSIGAEKAQNAQLIEFSQIIEKGKLDEKCKDCIVREACPTCYGSNYATTGSVYHKDDGMCVLTKIILKARSYFRAQQWERKLIDLSEVDEKLLLKSIMILQQL